MRYQMMEPIYHYINIQTFSVYDDYYMWPNLQKPGTIQQTNIKHYETLYKKRVLQENLQGLIEAITGLW